MKMKIRAISYIILLLVMATTAKAQLTGEWRSDNGACTRIRQVDKQVFWCMDDWPRVINVFMGYIAGNTITGIWADLPGGNISGSGTLALRVESPDKLVKIDQSGNYLGSVWTKGSCQTSVINPPSSRPDLSGVWYDYSAVSGYSGAVSKITQNGDKLVFINSFNNQSSGNFLDNSSVVASDWEDGLKAALENGAQKIVWKNGSVWERSLRSNPPSSKPDLSGVWYDYSAVSGYSGAVSKITQNGDKLVFLNSFNSQSTGYFLDNTSIIASDWEGGLKAALEDGARKIVWKNGSVWQRTKR